MASEAKLFKQGRYDDLWQKCCGFIDLSLDEFMRIQRRLLLEQLELLKRVGCDYWQGFYYTKPVNSETATEFLGPAPKSLQRVLRRAGVRDSGEMRRLRFTD